MEGNSVATCSPATAERFKIEPVQSAIYSCAMENCFPTQGPSAAGFVLPVVLAGTAALTVIPERPSGLPAVYSITEETSVPKAGITAQPVYDNWSPPGPYDNWSPPGPYDNSPMFRRCCPSSAYKQVEGETSCVSRASPGSVWLWGTAKSQAELSATLAKKRAEKSASFRERTKRVVGGGPQVDRLRAWVKGGRVPESRKGRRN
jgi:hypothetical protein